MTEAMKIALRTFERKGVPALSLLYRKLERAWNEKRIRLDSLDDDCHILERIEAEMIFVSLLIRNSKKVFKKGGELEPTLIERKGLSWKMAMTRSIVGLLEAEDSEIHRLFENSLLQMLPYYREQVMRQNELVERFFDSIEKEGPMEIFLEIEAVLCKEDRGVHNEWRILVSYLIDALDLVETGGTKILLTPTLGDSPLETIQGFSHSLVFAGVNQNNRKLMELGDKASKLIMALSEKIV